LRTSRGAELAHKLAAGHTAVNWMTTSDPRLPFGGIKDSGYGRELSTHGIREFVNAHSVVVERPAGPGGRRGRSSRCRFVAREPGEEFQHLPELEVHGLVKGDARALLSSVVRVKLDERVRDRITAETHGSPLALLELPHERVLALRDGDESDHGLERLVVGVLRSALEERMTRTANDCGPFPVLVGG